MNSKIQNLESQLQAVGKEHQKRVDLLNALFREIWVTEPKRAQEVAEESFQLSQKIAYDRGLAHAKTNMGYLCYSRAEVEKAMSNLLDALQWFEDHHDLEGEANANHGLAFIYWGFGDFQRGFDAISKTLKIFEKFNNCDGRAWAYNTLGSFYYDWKNYQQSREHFKKAYGIFRDTQNLNGQARALNGIGNAYHLMGDHTKALAYQRKSLKINQSMEYLYGESKTLNDIGLILQSLEKYEEALEYHQKSLVIRRKINYPQGETTNLLDIGQVYLKQKKIQQALKILHEALVLSQKVKAKIKTSKAHEALYQCYKPLGQLEKALAHHEKYHAIHEEVFHEDTETQFKNLKSAYQIESSKKEAEIYRLKNVELKAKNDALKQTLKQLNATQAQLVQSGKMVALGQLVAGIIHEINSPIGAIKSSVDVAERVCDILKQILESTDIQKTKEHYKKLISIYEILQQNNEITTRGTNRILKIIKSLKNFSRLDEATFQKTHIHDGLENTLTLLEHDLKDGIIVRKEYGDIPEIFHFPSELNQVFMNLLLNAIQSMPERGAISIQTFKENGHINIKIADTGKGIPQEKIAHLFEPGFTEKKSRVRMRTGLYSSYNIVLKHKGDIRVESEVGKGTTFTVSIPDNLQELLSTQPNSTPKSN